MKQLVCALFAPVIVSLAAGIPLVQGSSQTTPDESGMGGSPAWFSHSCGMQEPSLEDTYPAATGGQEPSL